MEQLIITVNHTHFKGNDYHHGSGEKGICPLSMAYEDQIGKRVFVGGDTIRDDRKGPPIWMIPSNWTSVTVGDYVKRANSGEEFTVDVTLSNSN